MMRFPALKSFVLILLGLSSLARHACADTSSSPLYIPQLLDAQVNYVAQQLDTLHSAYAGPLSLPTTGDQALSRTFGAYLGVPLPAHLAFYLDGELFTGGGVNKGTGLAGYVNGDVVRAGAGSGGKQRPYIARAYVDWNLPLGTESAPMERAQDQLPGKLATKRIEIKLGRLALADDFDKNRYANDTRHQFMNWDFIDTAAYDYAANTRGYSDGLIAAWVQPQWTLRYGVYLMPIQANGQVLAGPLDRARAEQVQLSLRPLGSDGFTLRLLAYRNIAKMGNYAEALALSVSSGETPEIAADARYGRRKHGYVINSELPLADGGDTGLFARWGWNDGHTQSFAYTEADRALSVGAQLSGVHWRRTEDRVGIALDLNGLANTHRAYLAAGGCGFLLCDGALDYGRERVIEAYYRLQVGHYLQLSPDMQWIVNPGYNRSRGPARVVGLRMHLSL
jgi:high affinity Mn2+ porin